MRIIAGEFGSRKLFTLENDSTRPTTDKVKEAVFNSVGPYFDGGRLLDMFSGSGSIALEGLSRGMDEAVLIDKNPKAIQIIKKNIDALKVKNRTKVYCGDYQSILKKLDVQNKFDYVYIDPPYAMDVIEKAFSLLKEMDLLNSTARIIVETKKEMILNERYDDIIKQKEAIYGITRITYFKKEIE